MTSQRHEPPRLDFLSQPLAAFALWGLPLIAGWSAEALPISRTVQTIVWAVALAWMGGGCALNAARCHRLHCFLAAPLLFLGALGAGAAAFGLDPLGDHTASYVINASLLLALLTFAIEWVWERYRPF